MGLFGASILLAIAAGVLALVIHLIRCLRSPLRAIPGPAWSAFSSLPLKAAVLSGRRIHFVHSLHQTYGSLVRIGPNEISVADAVAYKQIHGASSGFQKSNWYREMTMSDRDGVFIMNGRAHADRRRLLARPFSKSHLRQHWEAVVRERVELAVSRIREEAGRGPTDMLKWWTFMASDVSSHLMFGESFHTLEHGQVSDYIRKLQTALMGGGIGAELPWLRWVGRRLPFRICQDLWAVNDYLVAYGQQAVDGMKKSGGGTNIFASMMNEAEKGEKLDDGDVRQEAQNLIVAGTDTTSISLTYLIWAVLSRPVLRERIIKEVNTLSSSFHESDVEQLPLLNAVIDETLRLYGAAPGGLPRMVPVGGTVMSGFVLPEGTTVTTQAYTYHRDAELFPKPFEFEPERWLPDYYGPLRVSAAAKAVYSPFGTGPRTCLGVHLAYMELRLAAACFFRACSKACLAPSVTPMSMEFENFFLIAPKGHKCEITLA